MNRLLQCLLSAVVALVLWPLPMAAAGQDSISLPTLTANEIAQRLAERNRQRAEELGSYTSVRVYHLLYTGFPSRKEAEIVVWAEYEAPDRRNFTVLSQSGSNFLVNKVLKRLLAGEQQAGDKDNRARTALNTQNYDFELLGQDEISGRPCYTLRVSPKIDNKYLYRGRIWVDGTDFAVTKIDAEPAKRPSFWISKTTVRHSYTKINEFWLPSQNMSTTDVRLGGVATLTVTYGDYLVNRAAQLIPAPQPSDEKANTELSHILRP